MRGRRLLATVGVTVLVGSFGLVACGDDDDADDDSTTIETSATDEEATTTTADDGGDDDGASTTADTVTASDFAFDPSELTVGAGAEITFANEDGANHTLTADDDSFDTGTVAGGNDASVTAPNAAGEYPFHCDIHPSMTGTLTVE
jgi:plastocyanin